MISPLPAISPGSLQKVLVIILNYGTAALSEQAATSAQNSTGVQVDILLIDNGSRPAMPRCNLGPGCHQIWHQKNYGFAGGHNRGLAWAKARGYEWVCLLNSDAVLAEDALICMLSSALAHPASLVCPAITDGSQWWYRGGNADDQRCLTIHLGYGKPDHFACSPEASEEMATTLATGCCVLGSMSTWEKLEGLDEALFLYWEDFELSLRAQRLRIPVYFVPKARVTHGAIGSSRLAPHSIYRSPSFYYHYFNSRGILIRRRDVAVLRSLVSTPRLVYQHLRTMAWSFSDSPLLLRQLGALGAGLLGGLLRPAQTRRSTFVAGDNIQGSL